MQPDLELKPTSGTRFVLGAVGLVFLLATVATAAERGRHASPLGLVIVLGALAALSFAFAVLIGRRRLIVTRDGVEVRGVFGGKRLAWPEITSYTFYSIDTNHPMYYTQTGLGGVILIAIVRALRKKPGNRKFNGGQLALYAADGRKLRIASWFRDIDQALERIFAEVHARLQHAVGPQFGKLGFDGHTLSHAKKGALSLLEIEKVEVSPHGYISIRKVGKRLPWARVSMARTPCSLLLFERLAHHGIFVDMSGHVFVPLPTLGVLSSLAAARQNLPQARVQQR